MDIGLLHVSLLHHHHLNDNNRLKIALLASPAGIELLSSSFRVTKSTKFQKGTVLETPGPIDRTPETPGSGKKTNFAIEGETL